jgi:hypothetical protein
MSHTRNLILTLPLLAGCPYDASEVGLTKIDGGYEYNVGDAGYFIADSDASVGADTLSSAPTMEQLCTLYVGDLNDQNDYPHRTGTWIGDVERIFGPPGRNGAQLGQKDAQLVYLWKGANGDPSGMTLSFEYVLVQYKGDNGGPPHGYFKDSYWLNGIQMRDGSYYDCWRWELNEPGRTPCDGCIDASQFTRSCVVGTPNPSECFDR